MRIDDGQERLPKARVDRRHDALARPQLFLNPLEDQHVAVHRHADRQDHARDTRQRQHRPEVAQRGEQQNGVQNQSQHRVDARHAVVEQHKRDDRRQSRQARDQALPDRVRPQRGPHGPFFGVNNARRQRTRAQKLRQVRGFRFTAEIGDPTRVLDARLDGRHADQLVVQRHRQPVADVGFRKPAEPPSRVWAKRERSFPLAELVLTGACVSQVAAGQDGSAGHQVPTVPASAPRQFPHQARVGRQHAAMPRARLLLVGKRAVLDLVDAQDRRRADDLLHARRVVAAGQLHQNFEFGVRPPVLLHHRFGQTQIVDAGLDRLNRPLHGIALERQQFGRTDGQTVIRGAHGRQHPSAVAFIDQPAELRRLLRRNSLDENLDVVRFLDALRVVAFERIVIDVLALEVFLQALDHGVRFALYRVLHLHLQHQAAAPTQVQSQLDVLRQVPLQLRTVLRQPDNPVDTDQNRRDDDEGLGS